MQENSALIEPGYCPVCQSDRFFRVLTHPDILRLVLFVCTGCKKNVRRLILAD